MSRWRHGPRGAAAAALTALSLALLGCTTGQATPGHGSSGQPRPPGAGKAQPSGAGLAGFAWFRPASAPAAWLRAGLSGHGATLSYPNTLVPMHGDQGTVTVGRNSRSGAVLVYLNVTRRQGDETLRDWPGFRLEHLREDGESAVHVDGVSPSLNFRGGQGRCVIDNYTTDIHRNHYQEIACFVRGPHAASVLVAATSTGMWRTYQPLLDQVVSTYQAG
jgi:hypothetical protein